MAGPVPAIHVFVCRRSTRGCPARRPGMTYLGAWRFKRRGNLSAAKALRLEPEHLAAARLRVEPEERQREFGFEPTPAAADLAEQPASGREMRGRLGEDAAD